MIFEKGHLYHIFNQGNNKQKIFYSRDNYMFFIKKTEKYILPYADILAWCLMPNHFHFMVLVNAIKLPVYPEKIIHVRNRHRHFMNSKDDLQLRTFNNSIAILLRSYTRAINKQEGQSGSLFQAHTKAECLNGFKGVKPTFIQTNISTSFLLEEKQYPQVCFDYIHQNPVKANLVNNSTDWEFSSVSEYLGLRASKLINKDIADKYVDLP